MGLEDSSYMPPYSWAREETNSWEHSDNSDECTAVNKTLVFSFMSSKFHWSGLWPLVFVCNVTV